MTLQIPSAHSCFAVAFLFIGTNLWSQDPIAFSGPRAYLGSSAVVLDLNRDGILDLATVDGTTSAIHIHTGVGDGTFTGDDLVELAGPGNEVWNYSIASADLNGDGLADLAVGQYDLTASQYLIHTFLANPGGGFISAKSFIPNSGEISRLFFADLNDDGKSDLVLVDISSGISVQLGNGDGTFQPAIQVFSQEVATQSIAFADFNGDGKPDIVFPVANGIVIFFGDGTGRFPSGTTFTTIGTFGPVAAVDVNGDGRADLILETLDKGLVEVLLGKGNGTFGAPQLYNVGAPSQSAVGLALGDVNGDGILDIVTPDPAVLLGKGNGTFEDAVFYPSNSTWSNVQLVDLRGNGSLDIIGNAANYGAPGEGPYSTTVLLNAGGGRFEDGEKTPLKSETYCLAVADFNQDGIDDAAVSLSNGVEIFSGTGQARRALQPSLFLPFPDQPYQCAITGDFNGDGKPDILVNNGAGSLTYFPGNGDGTFGSPVQSTTPIVDYLATGDFNGDQKLDLVAIAGNGIQVYLGNGAGAFTPGATIAGPSNPVSIAAADLNGDGLPDVVVTGSEEGTDGYRLYVYLNNGNGSFHEQVYPLPQTLEYVRSALIADLNGDGVTDLVVLGSSFCYTFLGQGDGVFALTKQLSVNAFSGVLKDFNGDGIPDLAIEDSMNVKVFPGDGTGAFSSARNPDGLWFAPPGSVSSLAAANLQSQSAASGLADILIITQSGSPNYLQSLINTNVSAAAK